MPTSRKRYDPKTIAFSMSELRSKQLDQGTRKHANGRSVNRACVPCRARKVRCDAGAVGLPCSNCISRNCATGCEVVVRKRRTKVEREAQSTSLRSRNTSSICSQSSPRHVSPCQIPHQTGQDLLFLNILDDAVEKSTSSSQDCATSGSAPYSASGVPIACPSSTWAICSSLDDTDKEYLMKKGIFDLPSTIHLETFIGSFFDHVHAFVPVIDREDFVRDYRSGNYSLFLLYVVLTLSSLYVPTLTLTACGFSSRSNAQESFFTKAVLLHDITSEVALVLLQGSIMLCMVVLDHPTDRDLGYWLYNAARLATKLDLRNTCIREDRPHKLLKLYRRMWWSLYCIDNFHVFINTSRSRLLEDTVLIKPRTEDDLDLEDVSSASPTLLSDETRQQMILPVVYCELSRLASECLSIVKTRPLECMGQVLQPFDEWRSVLATRMHATRSTEINIHFLSILAMSYRFECILCRLMRRRWLKSRQTDWSAQARRRLGSAMLELDSIAARVSMNDALQYFPISFVTTLTVLLALHIEVALDTTETGLAQAMARNSISRTMIILNEGKEIPALKRALVVFDDILTRKNLHLGTANNTDQTFTDSQTRSAEMEHTDFTTSSDFESSSTRLRNGEVDTIFGLDFAGFDFLDEWHFEQFDTHGLGGL